MRSIALLDEGGNLLNRFQSIKEAIIKTRTHETTIRRSLKDPDYITRRKTCFIEIPQVKRCESCGVLKEWDHFLSLKIVNGKNYKRKKK